MQVKIAWQEGVSFTGQVAGGHTLLMDGPPDQGGHNAGARPMEMVLLGLGGCASFDLVQILNKSRQRFSGCELEIQAQRSDQIPAVFTDIHLRFKVTGKGLKDAVVERAVRLSMEKYCSVAAMLGKGGVTISHSYSIFSPQ